MAVNCVLCFYTMMSLVDNKLFIKFFCTLYNRLHQCIDDIRVAPEQSYVWNENKFHEFLKEFERMNFNIFY